MQSILRFIHKNFCKSETYMDITKIYIRDQIGLRKSFFMTIIIVIFHIFINKISVDVNICDFNSIRATISIHSIFCAAHHAVQTVEGTVLGICSMATTHKATSTVSCT